MATTCDFPAIKNPLDEVMRTCVISVINNEAVLKSVFREPEEKLTFSKAVDISTEVEEAAKTANAQVYSKPEEVHKIQTIEHKQYIWLYIVVSLCIAIMYTRITWNILE